VNEVAIAANGQHVYAVGGSGVAVFARGSGGSLSMQQCISPPPVDTGDLFVSGFRTDDCASIGAALANATDLALSKAVTRVRVKERID
jgi:hypothetical protein